MELVIHSTVDYWISSFKMSAEVRKSLLSLLLLQPLVLQLWWIKLKEPHERTLCFLLEVSVRIGEFRNRNNVWTKWPLIEQSVLYLFLVMNSWKLWTFNERRQIQNGKLQRTAGNWIWNGITVPSIMAIGLKCDLEEIYWLCFINLVIVDYQDILSHIYKELLYLV